MVSEEELVARLAVVEEQIIKACQRVGRRREEVHLLPVTKTMPPEVVRLAMKLGLNTFGENYVQDFRAKESVLCNEAVNWHFIGQLQSNKAKYLKNCQMIHTVDSLSTAREISRHNEVPKKILVEINCGEEQKGGVSPAGAVDFIRQISELPNLQILGLMTVAPLWAEGEDSRQFFAMLAKLRDNISAELGLGPEFRELSMGMSGDFEQAIEEGATWIRLGSVLFGERLKTKWYQNV